MTPPKRVSDPEMILIRSSIEDLREDVKPIKEIRDLLLGDGNKAGFVERLRAAELELERLGDEHLGFLREAPNRLKGIEEWAQNQRDFRRDLSRKVWGGLISGFFSLAIALFMAWRGSGHP